jgi:two-component system NarL family sensor kinase
MPPVDILWSVFVVTGIFLLIIGFFIATILLNQRKFITVQREKIAESKKLEEALRQLPQKMVEGQEEERKRVSKELHDGINQMLASIKYRIHAFRSSPAMDARGYVQCTEEISLDLDRTIEEVKRISHDLHPKILDDLGIQAAVRSLVEEFRVRSGLHVEIQNDELPPHLPRHVELGIFRIIQEALHNIEKHAAAMNVGLSIRHIGSSVYLTITDDGVGFDPALPSARRDGKGGLGLTTMKERALMMASILDIRSLPGKGTTVTLKIPPEFKEF